MAECRERNAGPDAMLRRHLHPVLKKLSVPKGGMHAFRHVRVSYLMEQNVPTELIKDRPWFRTDWCWESPPANTLFV